MFYQRPRGFPRAGGKCDLETASEPRAPKYSFLAQRFRLLDSVEQPQAQYWQWRAVSHSGRALCSHRGVLELNGDLTFSHVRKRLLKLPPARSSPLSAGAENPARKSDNFQVLQDVWRTLASNVPPPSTTKPCRTCSALRIPRRWHGAGSTIGNWTRRRRRSLRPSISSPITSIGPSGPWRNYCPFWKPVSPLPRRDANFTRRSSRLARCSIGFQDWIRAESRQAVGEVRNPAVTRSLTELRKVVNAIIRQYGKPVHIRIELAARPQAISQGSQGAKRPHARK